MVREAGVELATPMVIAGQIYRNTKRNTLYTILFIATNSEDDTDTVVYRDIESGRNFVRPLSMFVGMREVDGIQVPRFVLEECRGEG